MPAPTPTRGLSSESSLLLPPPAESMREQVKQPPQFAVVYAQLFVVFFVASLAAKLAFFLVLTVFLPVSVGLRVASAWRSRTVKEFVIFDADEAGGADADQEIVELYGAADWGGCSSGGNSRPREVQFFALDADDGDEGAEEAGEEEDCGYGEWGRLEAVTTGRVAGIVEAVEGGNWGRAAQAAAPARIV